MENKKHYDMNSEESLARSHSKSSNAKLTALSLFSSLTLQGAVCSVALYGKFENNILFIVAGACVVLFALTFRGFKKFTR